MAQPSCDKCGADYGDTYAGPISSAYGPYGKNRVCTYCSRIVQTNADAITDTDRPPGELTEQTATAVNKQARELLPHVIRANPDLSPEEIVKRTDDIANRFLRKQAENHSKARKNDARLSPESRLEKCTCGHARNMHAQSQYACYNVFVCYCKRFQCNGCKAMPCICTRR